LVLEPKSFAELFPIHERESTPFTKAPSKGVAPVGIGRGSSNAASRAHMELNPSVYKTRKVKSIFQNL
jgi:hypothetical protein